MEYDIIVVCVLCGTESLIESALSAGVVEILKDYIIKFSADEDVILMVLLAVGSLADSGNCSVGSYRLMIRLAVFQSMSIM